MLELIPVELRAPVWYILAGFILGFTVSTLWEWLYFRRFRLAEDQDVMGSDILPTESAPLTHPTTAERGEANKLLLDDSEEVTFGDPTIALPNITPAPSSSDRSRRLVNDSATRISTYRSPGVFLESENVKPEWLGKSNRQEVSTVTTMAPPTLVDLIPPVVPPQVEMLPVVAEKIATLPITETTVPVLSPSPTLIAHPLETNDHVPAVQQVSPPVVSAITPPMATEGVGSTPPPSEVSPPSEMPRTVPRSRGYPDNLAEIRGIGDVYKRRLYQANIFTFHHVATSDIDFLRQVTQASPNANVEEWPNLAKTLAEKYSRQNASYSGPLPNDLTKITGIGPFYAQTLYRIGICTYAQLADTTIEELAALFPPTQLGRKNNFEEWVHSAKQMVAELSKP